MVHGRAIPRRGRIGAAWCAAWVLIAVAPGCVSPKAYTHAAKENETLRRRVDRLSRNIAARDSAIVELRERITNLESFSADRPADLFAPASVEILSLSGGDDYDGRPGDDGVTVHLRPRDADGDVVKAPGRITVQLIDNTDLASPRVLGVCTFDKPEALRHFWYGRFLTQYYALRCPFTPGASLPASRRITVSVAFVDYLTGRKLTAVKEVSLTSRQLGEPTGATTDGGP